MAQELEQIVELLREMRRANITNSESFDRLLTNIGRKLDMLDQNSTSTELLKAYFGEIAKSVEEKYSTTLNKFSDIERALKAIFQEQGEHVKNKDIKELFDSFTSSMNNFYTEARQQKVLLSGIESRLSEMNNDDSDKNDILRTITLLRNDFENLNHGYKNIIDSVNADLKTILTNLIKTDQTTINSQIKDELDSLYKATNDIVVCLNSIDKRDANLEILLSQVATGESLKLAQGAIESIIKKSEEISDKINTLADKPDIESLQSVTNIMNQKLDETVTKELFTKIANTTESLVGSTDEIKKTLADVTQNIESLPDTTVLNGSVQDLYQKLEDLSADINEANVKENIVDIDKKLEEFNTELNVIQNIISDLNEVITSKVLTAINDISFAEDFSEIKDHVSKMISELPQKEDIEKLFENDEKNKSAVEDLIKNTDLLVDRLDNLPTHEDMATLNSNQLSLVENLQEVANKDDIENLSSKADDIEKLIDDLNFDDEFKSIYDKTSNLEEWLEKSKLKENVQDVADQIPSKAEQKDVLDILDATNKIVEKISEISEFTDAKNISKSLTDVYSQIEELKTEFLNSTELHNDSIISRLEKIQDKLSNASTSEEFNLLSENLKEFTEAITIDSKDTAENIEKTKQLQEELLAKIDGIDFSEVQSNLNSKIQELESNLQNRIEDTKEELTNQSSQIDEKLVSLSDYLNTEISTNNEDIKNEINNIREILLGQKSSFEEIEAKKEQQIIQIKDYLEELKTVLDTSNSDTNENIKSKFENIEKEISSYQEINKNLFGGIISKLDECENLTKTSEESPTSIGASLTEISEIKHQLQTLGESFATIKSAENSSEKEITKFVSEKLEELSSNLETLTDNVESGLNQGFAYNAELIEEKTATLLDFIKELRHSSTNNIELYERLTVTDNKLMDFQQELELINTDVINSLNAKTDKMLKELAPIKEMISCLAIQTPDGPQSEKVKEQLGLLHQSVQDDLAECTKYSKSAFDKIEETYQNITRDLTNTENNIRDFVLGDIDSVIIKIDELRNDLEKLPKSVDLPDANRMIEFQTFTSQIKDFREEQKSYLKEFAQDIKTSITDKMQFQHDEIKSMLTVAINNKEIVQAIEDLKKCFISKIKELNVQEQTSESENSAPEEFKTNELENVFEENKNDKILSDIKKDFTRFTDMISQLSGENSEIIGVLNSIKDKIDTISIQKQDEPLDNLFEKDSSKDTASQDEEQEIELEEDVETDTDTDDFEENEFDDLGDTDDDIDTDSDVDTDDDVEDFEDLDNTSEEEVIVGANNFDFVKAFDLLKQDVNNLRADIERVLPPKTSIPTLGNNNLLMTLNNKIELLAKTVNKNWLEEVKQYIESSDIHAMLEEINGKIDILTLSDNSEWISEIKQALDQLNGNDFNSESNKEIHSMLSLISEKIDILASSDDYDLMEDVRDAIERIYSENSDSVNGELKALLNTLNQKVDIIAESDNSDQIDELRDALEEIESKIDILSLSSDDDNSEDFKQLKNALSSIEAKIDILALPDEDKNADLEDLKESLTGIENKITTFSEDDKTNIEDLKETLTGIENKITAFSEDDKTNIEDLKSSLIVIENKINTFTQDDEQINEIKKSLKNLEKNIDLLSQEQKEQRIQKEEYSEIFETLKETLETIECKIDTIVTTEDGETDDIKYTLLDVDEKINALKPVQERIEKLSESDVQITSMLELLNHKIDIISSSEESLNTAEDIEDVKQLILAQTDYIERLEHNNKTDAVKKCLKELTVEVNNLGSNSGLNTKQLQKSLRDMKESIMAAVVTIFEQVSFIEESEDIKDFVEEKTDVINQNLAAVTKQLKQITNASDDNDYTYSMQDIESDLAKLRLAMNEIQNNAKENEENELSNISDNLYRITSSVEELQNSMTPDEIKEIKYYITNLQDQTQKLLISSDESYNALNTGLEDFGKIITNQISSKVDNVTKMLEKSSDSDKVMRQALIYMGEWIDSASESMNKISTNSDELLDVKSTIEDLKAAIPEQKDILSSLEEKFDEQQERLSYFEKQISKLGNIEERFEEQQERIDRLEMTISKVLSAVEDIDDSKVSRKIDKIDKQLAKLSTNIEKLASYVD